jgi:hypothetical protein
MDPVAVVTGNAQLLLVTNQGLGFRVEGSGVKARGYGTRFRV